MCAVVVLCLTILFFNAERLLQMKLQKEILKIRIKIKTVQLITTNPFHLCRLSACYARKKKKLLLPFLLISGIYLHLQLPKKNINSYLS